MTYLEPRPARPSIFRRYWIWVLLITVAAGIGFSDARTEKIRSDFSEYSLAASRVMFAGGNPYDKSQVLHNYKYFPANAILLYPFTFISVYAAQGIWFAINLGLLIWAFGSMRAMLRPIKIPWWITLIALAITFRLITMNLRLGQWNTSVFCLSIIGLRYLHDGRRWGGILLALAITLKFMPAVFLVYLAARRRWKDLAVTLAATVFWIALLPIVTMGPTRTLELIRQHKSVSERRLTLMTEGTEVSSLSVHSTLYRALSPVMLELKGDEYYFNIFNLPHKQGSLIAKIFSAIFTLIAVVWLTRQGRRIHQINETGTLILVGLCYLAWFIAAPGVRQAQLISTTPLAFAIAAAAYLSPEPRTRRVLWIGLGLTFLLFSAPAELFDESQYNRILEGSGILALALLLETALGVYAYYKVGLGTLRARNWEFSENDNRLVGDPRY